MFFSIVMFFIFFVFLGAGDHVGPRGIWYWWYKCWWKKGPEFNNRVAPSIQIHVGVIRLFLYASFFLSWASYLYQSGNDPELFQESYVWNIFLRCCHTSWPNRGNLQLIHSLPRSELFGTIEDQTSYFLNRMSLCLKLPTNKYLWQTVQRLFFWGATKNNSVPILSQRSRKRPPRGHWSLCQSDPDPLRPSLQQFTVGSAGTKHFRRQTPPHQDFCCCFGGSKWRITAILLGSASIRSIQLWCVWLHYTLHKLEDYTLTLVLE